MIESMSIYVVMLLILLGLLIPVVTLINLWFYYKPAKKRRLSIRILFTLVILLVPLGWLIYLLIKDKVK